MDLQTFVSTKRGEVLDNGLGQFAGECVSLVWQYANEAQHVPLGVLYCSNTGGARDLYEQFGGKIPQYYTRVPKDQLQAGDIVVWGGPLGPLGHTAPKVDGPGLTVFEQMAGVPARLHTYTNLNGVLGGLRLISGGGDVQDRVKQLEASEQKLAQDVVDRDNRIAALEKRISALERSEQDLAQDVVDRDKTIEALKQSGDFELVTEQLFKKKG